MPTITTIRRSHLSRHQKSLSVRTGGFTIVELLIVIVVIAILAVITIVAFNGIQKRAQASAASSALSQAARKVGLYQVDNGNYPTALTDVGIQDANGTTYQYSSTAATYCITATVGSTSMYASNTAPQPTAGGCPGHGQGGVGAVTNYVLNPDIVGTNAMGFNLPANASLATANGIATVTVTNPAAGNGLKFTAAPLPGFFYSAKFKIRAFGGAVGKGTIPSVLYDSATRASSSSLTLTSSWQEVDVKATTQSTGTYMALLVYFGYGVSWAVGDGIEVTQPTIQRVDSAGQTVPSGFASGSSPNWIWNGTPNNSTSTGPAL